MKTKWNKDQQQFLTAQIRLFAQAIVNSAQQAADEAREASRKAKKRIAPVQVLDKPFLKYVIRLSEKFAPNRLYVPLKQKEIDLLLEIITVYEFELESKVIPHIEKGDSPEKEAQLGRARDLLKHIEVIVTQLKGYQNKDVSLTA